MRSRPRGLWEVQLRGYRCRFGTVNGVVDSADSCADRGAMPISEALAALAQPAAESSSRGILDRVDSDLSSTASPVSATIERVNAISGTVYLRPVRLGFVIEKATTEAVVCGARLASSVWGGVYFPILKATDPNVLMQAEALAVDVLYPLDESEAAAKACDTPGLKWRGGAQWGPFGADSSDFREGLLSIDRLGVVGSSSGADELETVSSSPLLEVWLGHGAGGDRPGAERPSLDDLWADGDPWAASPLARTASHIEYRGVDSGLNIVVVGDDPADLLRLWNVRACGGTTHPWPVGLREENLRAVEAWLSRSEVLSLARRARRGDGAELGPTVDVLAGEHHAEAEWIRVAVEALGVHALAADRPLLGGWTGNHPFSTSAERDLNVIIDQDARQVAIPLPTLPWLEARRLDRPGTVAADVHVFSEPEFSSTLTFALPGIRSLAEAIDRFTVEHERFHRPSGEGRIVGVQANATSVDVALIPALSVFETVLPDEATLGQSDDGLFAAHLVDRLGGMQSVAANQPALRKLLYDLSNSGRSQPIPRLIQSALDGRGDWPHEFSRQTPRDYAKSVAYGLINTGLVVPTLSLRCPRCSTEVDVRPGDLDTDMRCVVCRRELNLGLALAVQGGGNPWRYQLAGHLPPGRIRSGLAVMAANSILRSAHRGGHVGAAPHLFGLTVQVDGWSCEVDLASFISDGPVTLAVVGELKGGLEAIDAKDLANLQRLQGLLRAQGIETFILAGTTRDRLFDEEISLLRSACEAAPERISRHSHDLALPIVLCGPDMSMPWMNEHHPWRWGTPGEPAFAGLAKGGCRRNLGLADDGPKWAHSEDRWTFEWRRSDDG